jgi:uncharacterized glyoxalase superfamily protein PhnB
MATQVRPIPEGYHAITPDLIVKDVSKAISFYTTAFGARELLRFDGPDGKVMHAEVQIGDSRLMICGECKEKGCRSPASLSGNTGQYYLYVNNADATFEQAAKAGGKVLQPVTEMFWGDRVGELLDPSGHRWMIATHTRDLAPEEIKEGAEKFFAATALAK